MRLCLAFALVLAIGCKKSDEGLPPAQSWQDNAVGGTLEQQPKVAARDVDDPHRGVVGAPPLGSSDDTDDPHRGVVGAPPLGRNNSATDDPHRGVVGAPPLVGGAAADGAPDVTKLGLPPPDPDRPIDPTRRLRGTLKASAKVRSFVKPNGTIFLVVKQAGAGGAPSGPPLAVEKVIWAGDSVAFDLTEANAMIAGTKLAGDVVIVAHYDQDIEPMTKEPGDVFGQLRAKVPADSLVLELDTVIP